MKLIYQRLIIFLGIILVTPVFALGYGSIDYILLNTNTNKEYHVGINLYREFSGFNVDIVNYLRHGGKLRGFKVIYSKYCERDKCVESGARPNDRIQNNFDGGLRYGFESYVELSASDIDLHDNITRVNSVNIILLISILIGSIFMSIFVYWIVRLLWRFIIFLKGKWKN